MTQPDPTPNDNPPIVDLVIEDLRQRKLLGIERYGTPLQAFNGRDPLLDAFEEAMDLVIYLKQCLMERDASRNLS